MKDPNNMWEISESQDVKAEQSPPRNRVSKTQNQNKRVSNLIKDELLKNEESIIVDQKYLTNSSVSPRNENEIVGQKLINQQKYKARYKIVQIMQK